MKGTVKEKTFCNIFNALGILMYVALFGYCLRLTGENSAILEDEYIYFKTDSVFLNVIKICIALFFLCFIGKVFKKFNSLKHRNILLAIVCLLSIAAGFWWICVSKTAPQADQLIICNFANAFNEGDFSGLQKGGYVAINPQQLGMITLIRVVLGIFGSENYMAFKCLSVLSVPLLVFSGCKIVRILSNDDMDAELYYLLFILFCFPMYAYTSFIYGDLISIAIGLFSVWMFLSCLKCYDWRKLILFGISIGIAVQLRENLLVLTIALGIVVLIKLLFNRRWEDLALAAALVLGLLVMHFAVNWLYRDVKEEDAAAIPAAFYIIMGMNDDYGHAGWYNEYNYIAFDEADYDLERAGERARKDLKTYVDLYSNDPGYMMNFFMRKMNAQWNAPMYQSIAMNARVEAEQSPLLYDIFHRGRVSKLIESGMKIYQLLLYGSILFLLAVRRKDIIEIESYLLLIAVFGGFLFSLMWEAKTRYVLPYLFMQLPYMAIGVNEILKLMEAKFLKNKHIV